MQYPGESIGDILMSALAVAAVGMGVWTVVFLFAA